LAQKRERKLRKEKRKKKREKRKEKRENREGELVKIQVTLLCRTSLSSSVVGAFFVS
jgi:hypothetical protein